MSDDGHRRAVHRVAAPDTSRSSTPYRLRRRGWAEPAFAGGFPAGTGRVAVLRESDVRQELAAGRFPTLDLAAAETLPSICRTVIERDDVVLSFAGGGGGLGDPLRRDGAAVASDVRDGRVSTEAARTVYRVCLQQNGDVDEMATDDARAAMRRQRLVDRAHGPLSYLDDSSNPIIAVALDHARQNWVCAACGHHLGPATANWRSSAHVTERSVIDALQAGGQLARPRTGKPCVVQRELVCPGCGSMLSVDIAMAGDPLDHCRQALAAVAAGA